MKDVVDSQRIEILVEGIDDPILVGAIEAALRDSLQQTALPGPWRVVVTPSGVGGRWDFSVRGPGRRHLMTITVPRELLPELIPRRLRESLYRSAACLVERVGDRRPILQSDAGGYQARGPRREALARAI
jgi:hypothetical protein